MPYLMLGYSAAVLLMLAGCRVSAWTIPGLPGVRLLSWGCFSGLVGVVLMGLRTVVPLWATIILSNEAILGWSFFLYWATVDTLGRRARFLRPGGLLLLGALVWNSYFTYDRPDLTARILVASGVPAIFAAVTAFALFRHWPETKATAITGARGVPTVALASLQVLTFLQHTIRCILTVLHPPAEILHLDLIQAAFSYSNLILNVAAGCGVIWLALCTQRNDLHARAETDGLTGLLNRRAFEEILAREIRVSRETDAPFAILMTDIDRFKEVNDAWGHQAGDEVIRQVSAALRRGIRPTDALSRFGGEEFIVLLRGAGLAQAEEVAERLRTDVANLTGLPGGAGVTVSIGVAAHQRDQLPDEILRRCDMALYQSKRAGRNRVTVDRGPAPMPFNRAHAV